MPKTVWVRVSARCGHFRQTATSAARASSIGGRSQAGTGAISKSGVPKSEGTPGMIGRATCSGVRGNGKGGASAGGSGFWRRNRLGHAGLTRRLVAPGAARCLHLHRRAPIRAGGSPSGIDRSIGATPGGAAGILSRPARPSDSSRWRAARTNERRSSSAFPSSTTDETST